MEDADSKDNLVCVADVLLSVKQETDFGFSGEVDSNNNTLTISSNRCDQNCTSGDKVKNLETLVERIIAFKQEDKDLELIKEDFKNENNEAPLKFEVEKVRRSIRERPVKRTFDLQEYEELEEENWSEDDDDDFEDQEWLPKLNEESTGSEETCSEDNNIDDEIDDQVPRLSVSKKNNEPDKRKESGSEPTRDGSENPKEHSCSKCEKSFKQSSHLRRHAKSAHDEVGAHTCIFCWETFCRPDTLKLHIQKHKDQEAGKGKQFPCPECNKKFAAPQNLKRHVQLTHKGEKKFHCEKCSKSFTQSSGLARHMLTHRDKQFQCETCGKKFARLFVLKRHEFTHTDDKPYKCFVCSKGFIRASQLSDHVWLHRKDNLKIPLAGPLDSI